MKWVLCSKDTSILPYLLFNVHHGALVNTSALQVCAMMNFNQITRPSVGADSSCTQPIMNIHK